MLITKDDTCKVRQSAAQREPVLCSCWPVQIADFGVAHLFEEGESVEVGQTEGTFHFMAPECCTGARARAKAHAGAGAARE